MGWIGVGGGATHTPNLRQRFRFEANALTVSNFRRAYLSLSLSLSLLRIFPLGNPLSFLVRDRRRRRISSRPLEGDERRAETPAERRG